MPYKLDQEQTQLYQDYSLDNEYTFVPGTIVLPVATDDPDEDPVDVVQIHQGFRQRTVRFSAKKDNTPPLIPSPETVGSFTFIGGSVEVAAPFPLSNNQFRWQVAGELQYICSTGNSAGLILGTRPMIFEQQGSLPQFPNTTDLPPDVQEAGRGPITGYHLGEQVDLNNPSYTYGEISYFPLGPFSSPDLLTGPENYPLFS